MCARLFLMQIMKSCKFCVPVLLPFTCWLLYSSSQRRPTFHSEFVSMKKVDWCSLKTHFHGCMTERKLANFVIRARRRERESVIYEIEMSLNLTFFVLLPGFFPFHLWYAETMKGVKANVCVCDGEPKISCGGFEGFINSSNSKTRMSFHSSCQVLPHTHTHTRFLILRFACC